MLRSFFVCLLLFTINIFPQNYFIAGSVYDTSSNKPLTSVNVIILVPPDTFFRGTATDNEGRFKISLTNGEYILKVTHIGYKPYIKTFKIKNSSIILGKIFLSPDSIKLGEVKVIDKIPPVVLKKDTIEFNADAFKTSKDANVEQLIKKMPGITVEDGKIQARGEDVKKVLVDGKSFWGDDPNAAITNLPAEVVDKIQVFDNLSEQTRFTGFDDIFDMALPKSKTMNIITRNRFRNSTFGKFSTGGGGGLEDDFKYQATGNINFFNNEQRITILSQLNNVNEQNFSIEDILGVMTSSGNRIMMRGGGFRGRSPGGGMMIRMGNPPRGGGFSGRSPIDFLVKSSDGISITRALGTNYTDVLGEKVSLEGSYFLNSSDNKAETLTSREYFVASGVGQYYSENNLSESDNLNNRLNLKLTYLIDSSNSILFTPRISAQWNNTVSSVFSETFSGLSEGLLSENSLNSTNYENNSDLTAINSSAELLFRHRFEKTGRTLSIGLNSSYRKDSGEKKLYSENIYYNDFTTSDTVNQVSRPDISGIGGSSNIVYTEPVGETGIIQINARLSLSEDESDQKTFTYLPDVDSYSLLDSSLSIVYKKTYQTKSLGTGYRYQKDELTLIGNISYSSSQLESDQTFPQTLHTEKNFQSLLPAASIRYDFSNGRNLSIFYRTNSTEPSIDQLQSVLDNSNPVQLSIGNPDLKSDYRHIFVMRYSQMSMERLHSFFILFGGSLVNNYIGNNIFIAGNDTTIDGIAIQQGAQLTKPINLDGYINFHSFLTYGFQLDFIRSNLNLNLLVNFTRTPGIINEITNYSNSFTYGLGVVWSSNVSENLDFTLSSSTDLNNVKNNKKKEYDKNYITQITGLRFEWSFWEGLIFRNDFNHTYDSGLSEYNRNFLLWNLSIGKKFLKEDRGEIRFSVNDALNQNTNIHHSATGQYTEDTKSNVLGRYFLLSFYYNLQSFDHNDGFPPMF
jgi:hypothetical protein